MSLLLPLFPIDGGRHGSARISAWLRGVTIPGFLEPAGLVSEGYARFRLLFLKPGDFSRSGRPGKAGNGSGAWFGLSPA